MDEDIKLLGLIEKNRKAAAEVDAGLSSQLDANANVLDGITLNKDGAVRQCVAVFINDDGFDSHYGQLKPIFSAAGVPCSMALITNDQAKITEEHILDLYADGWEFGSHTVTHPNLTTLTAAQIDTELKDSQSTILSYGVPCNFLAYPGGNHNALVRSIAKKYYKFAFTTGAAINGYPLNTYKITRVAVGAYYDTPNGGYSDTTSLDYYKGKFDEAYAAKSCVVFMLHGYENDTQKQNIIDLIDYIKSKNVQILTPSQAYALIGNVITTGDPADNASQYFVLGRTGDVSGSDITPNNCILISSAGITINTACDSFAKGKISVCSFLASSSSGFPKNDAGTLITFRSEISSDLSWQIWYPHASDYVYRRRMSSATVWGSFVRIGGQRYDDLASIDTYASTTAMTTFPDNQVTYSKVSNTYKTGFPEDAIGTLITYKLGGDAGYWFQLYHVYNSNAVYKRTWKSTGIWTHWSKMVGIISLTSTQRAALSQYEIFAGYCVFDTTLGKPVWRNAASDGWVDATGTAV